ncbi:MAG: hypothetical protein ACOCXX_01125 [Planctomycetota bacterium]
MSSRWTHILVVVLMAMLLVSPLVAQDNEDAVNMKEFFTGDIPQRHGPAEYNQYCWLFFIVLGSFSCYLVFKGVRRM